MTYLLTALRVGVFVGIVLYAAAYVRIVSIPVGMYGLAICAISYFLYLTVRHWRRDD